MQSYESQVHAITSIPLQLYSIIYIIYDTMISEPCLMLFTCNF